jgi:ectoine hydroxylase-related dioxygenase (phytanoyl-CoA dioxygenase family)
MDEYQQTFFLDGVVYISKALDQRGIEAAEGAFRWTLSHPGPGAQSVLVGQPGAFFQDHANPNAITAYRSLLCETPLSKLVADVLRTQNLWLLYEQIWLKEGGERLPTPWHQDLPYVPISGEHLATVWLTLDHVRKDKSLEFVRASHRGPLFNPSAFNANDPTAAMFEAGVWPPLPDIESKREQYEIVSWATEPGDVIVFHPAILHGGAPTCAGERRRTISLRFFGDHAYCAERPERGVAEVDRLLVEQDTADPMRQMAKLQSGTLFRHPGFHKVV